MQMTRSEIIQRISQLEREVSSTEDRRAEAERNMCQLEALKASCNEYQVAFERSRMARKARLQDFCRILGQARLAGEYDAVLEELLNGVEYTRASEGMNAAKWEISREMERQRQAMNEYSSQMAGLHGSISHWRQQLVSAGGGMKGEG